MELSAEIEGIIRDAASTVFAAALGGIEQRATFSDIVKNTKETINELGCRLLEQVFKEVEKAYEKMRDKHRVIVRNKNKTRNLLTEMGSITVHHTLYFDKSEDRYFFAIDEMLQLERYSRIEQNLQAKLVADATITSFGKASALSNDVVSRQTVYNLTKRLQTIDAPVLKTERGAKEIFVEADEDHIHLKDGNPAEMKLVYVHEGRTTTNGRTALKNPRYFVSIESDSDNLWNDVSDYILTNYRAYKASVHLSGDGAQWIKNGIDILPNAEYHLDKFHVQKALMNISRGDKRLQTRLRRAVYSKDINTLAELSKSVYNRFESGSKRRLIGNCYLYVSGNLSYISRENRCSAEGHVSHVLSARMSSRPMAWTRAGAERMAKLRAYFYNNGDFVQLIRTGKSEPIKQPHQEMRRYSRTNNYNDGIAGAPDIHTYPLPACNHRSAGIARILKNLIKF